jgi:isocitrate lyase
MSAITNKPQWITDILTTLQDAGTDEAAFEMVERLTEELIEKEERLIAMEKKVEDYQELKDDRALRCRRAIRYAKQVKGYEDMIWHEDMRDTMLQTDFMEETFNGDHPEDLIAELIGSFDIYKEILCDMPTDYLDWKEELITDICDSLHTTFRLNMNHMDIDEVIDNYYVDVDSETYQQVYNDHIEGGDSERYAKNEAVLECVRENEGKHIFSIHNIMDTRPTCHNGFRSIKQYTNIYGDKDYFLVSE